MSRMRIELLEFVGGPGPIALLAEPVGQADPAFQRIGTNLTVNAGGAQIVDFRNAPPLAAQCDVAGGYLLGGLATNKGIADALAYFSPRKGAWSFVIDVDQAPNVAEDLPWELLCDNGANPPRFLALDQYARIVRQVTSRNINRVRIDGALRICAVLSAAGVSADKEWAALEAAIRNLPAAYPIPIELTVLIGEEALRSTIEAAALPQCKRVAFIPNDYSKLMDAIRTANPHVLHVFAHGRIDPFPHIDLAIRLDHDAGTPTGSLAIDDAGFGQILENATDANGWLLVLSACQGAQQTDGVGSLTSVAVRKGFLAAVGMREPVDLLDTAAFTSGFYGTLLRSISTGGAATRVDIASAVSAGREAIAKRYVGGGLLFRQVTSTTKPWSYPTLYAALGGTHEVTVEAAPSAFDPLAFAIAAGVPEHLRGEFLETLAAKLAATPKPSPTPPVLPLAPTTPTATMLEPPEIQISAWTPNAVGPRNAYDVAAGLRWLHGEAARKDLSPPPDLLWGKTADLADFMHADVGWGLLLPERPGQSVADSLAAADAPQCLRDLLAYRAGVVLRYSNGEIRRPGESAPLSPALAAPGKGPGELPRYLLLCGTPQEIPWRLQYRLAMRRFVGRLDLSGPALDRYVAAVIANFPASQVEVRNTVLWSVVLGANDITAKMSATLAEPLRARFESDPDLKGRVTRIAGGADAAQLGQSLVARRPSLVVTTSHGMTDVGPAIGNTLGLPVGADNVVVDPAALMAGGWSPDGCIWYAHACCSGGCDGVSLFKDLVAGWASIKPTFDALEGLGPTSSPLARALLSADKPARAFIGHVEPTFDWTLVGDGAQPLTVDFDKVFYQRIFGFEPIGLALGEWYTGGLTHLSQSALAIGAYNSGDNAARATMVQERLRGLDRLSMVLYGDPAVSLTRPTGGTP